MKVLVTGSSGRLGPYVVDELDRAGHELVLFSRRKPTADTWPWVAGDIGEAADCLKAVAGGGFDAIQHLAAQAWPTDHPTLRDKALEADLPLDTTMRSNVLGTYNLLQAAVATGISLFIMTGSNCALGHGYRISDKPFPFRFLPVDEEHPPDVEDSYSLSKLLGEEMLASYTRAYGMRTYVVRSAGICDPERRETMRRDGKTAQSWNPWLWAWVGSEDVASAHRLLMERAHEIEPHGSYFCNGNDTAALEPTVQLIETHAPGLAGLIRDLPGHASLISNEKLRRTVGWSPRTSWREAKLG